MRTRGLIAAIGVLAVLLSPAPVRAQLATPIIDACHEMGADARQCRNLGHIAHTLGVACRDVLPASACAGVDGTAIEPERVSAHERSWVAKALALQRGLDDPVPLREELWTHTHNSYNADVYGPTIYGLDRNQIYSVTDQLRMGIRAIEIDIHWAHTTSGSPESGGRAVVVCHGSQVSTPATTVHGGCGVNDPPLADRLGEIRAWLDRNPSEVVLLYLENQLEDSLVAHAEAVAAVRQAFGPLVHRPSRSCAPLPYDRSRADIAATGARVLITGNCGPGAWGDWVHVRGVPGEVPASASRWLEGGLDHGDDYPAFPCTQRRREQAYERNWIRHWGDETGLSNGSGGGGDVTRADARNMARCGVNMIGLDNLVPFDERLAELVWSWAPGEPRQGACAYQGRDGRFRSSGCGHKRRFACHDGTTWTIPVRAGAWGQGAKVCARYGTSFAVPRTGFDNEQLKAVAGGAELWMAYRRTGADWRS